MNFIRHLMSLLMGLLITTQLSARDSIQSPLSVDSAYLALIDSSFMYGGARKWSEAEQALKAAIALKPNAPMNAYLLNNLGGLQQMQGRVDEAILSYSAALERMPDEQNIRYNRARLFSLSGRHGAAITDYSLLIARAPENELYLYQRAMTYLLSGNLNLADTDLTTLIDRNGESLKARMAYALLETMRENYDNAERLYDYLVSKLPRHAEVYEGRARLYLAKGMKGYAQRDVDKAIELSRTNPSPSLYRLRAELARRDGDEDAAQRYEREARGLELQFDPLRNIP